MPSLAAAQHYLESLQTISTLDGLRDALEDTSDRLGCRYFALSQHVDFLRAPASALRLHNYPESWQEWFDGRGLGVSDPIHRASHVTAFGFRWAAVSGMINLSKADQLVLSEAYAHGIGDGFTVPGNVPGETLGSCSFAVRAGDNLREERIPFAQFAGQLLFETGRRLAVKRPTADAPALTDRQVECIMWVGRGKTDWEIAQILGVSQTTVIEHLRNARERYDASTRSMLTVRALYDGAVCFSDLIV
jgi:LuxR family quorum-sensing system transcriptional regulator CciR